MNSSTAIPASTSARYNDLVKLRDEAKQIRLRARAKEAKTLQALTRLLPIIPEKISTRLMEIENELLIEEEVPFTDDPTEMLLVTSSESIASYCENLRNSLPKRFKLRDIVSSAFTENDTRHQDAKDIERDAIRVETEVSTSFPLFGSNIGYDGAVKAISDCLSKCSSSGPSDPQGLIKFARVLLNAANRTTSGGDAFEAIERFIRAPQLVFVAPDSSAPLEPLLITCQQGVFKNRYGFDWGVKGKTVATTTYLVYDNDDIDRKGPLAKLTATCTREFGLALPLPEFDDRSVFLDDGKSVRARKDFQVDDGGILDITGVVFYDGAKEEEESRFRKLLDG